MLVRVFLWLITDRRNRIRRRNSIRSRKPFIVGLLHWRRKREREELQKEKDSVSCVDFISEFQEKIRNKKREAFFNFRGVINFMYNNVNFM